MPKPIKNNLVIEMHVPDLNVVKDFYSKLGFEISMDDEPNEQELGYMSMTRKDATGNTMLDFYGGDERVYNQAFFKQFPKDTKKGYAMGIVIPTGDIESLYKLATTHLGKYIVREIKVLKDHQLSWKNFRMVDPFGFYIRFTELIDWGQQ